MLFKVTSTSGFTPQLVFLYLRFLQVGRKIYRGGKPYRKPYPPPRPLVLEIHAKNKTRKKTQVCSWIAFFRKPKPKAEISGGLCPETSTKLYSVHSWIQPLQCTMYMYIQLVNKLQLNCNLSRCCLLIYFHYGDRLYLASYISMEVHWKSMKLKFTLVDLPQLQ